MARTLLNDAESGISVTEGVLTHIASYRCVQRLSHNARQS